MKKREKEEEGERREKGEKRKGEEREEYGTIYAQKTFCK